MPAAHHGQGATLKLFSSQIYSQNQQQNLAVIVRFQASQEIVAWKLENRNNNNKTVDRQVLLLLLLPGRNDIQLLPGLIMNWVLPTASAVDAHESLQIEPWNG